jgi:biopolymer transport protein ExbD
MAVAKLKAVVARLGDNITADDLPEVHIRGDQSTPYKCIGGAIFQMQSAGFARVGFISQPNGPSAG